MLQNSYLGGKRGTPGHTNEELNGQTLAVNVLCIYVKVSEFNAELEQEAQTLIKKENKS